MLIPRCSEYDLVEHEKHRIANEVMIGSISIAVALIPLAINGVLSHFAAGQSTQSQRIWTMTWLAVGIAQDIVGQSSPASNAVKAMLIALPYSAPAIGGMVIVGQMLRKYGTCVRLY